MSKPPAPDCADLLAPPGVVAEPRLDTLDARVWLAEQDRALTRMCAHLAQAERHAAGNAEMLRLLDRMRADLARAVTLNGQLTPPSDEAWTREVSETLPGLAPPSRILFVEDDTLVAEEAIAVLQDLGFEVEHCRDAESALALLGVSTFDLVVSDIVLPGMSGIDLASAIADRYPGQPILLATGYSSAALAQGARRFPILAKPYSMQELSRRVAAMLP